MWLSGNKERGYQRAKKKRRILFVAKMMHRPPAALWALIFLVFIPPKLNARGGPRDWSHGRKLELFSSAFAGSTEGWGLEAEKLGSKPAPDVTTLRAENRALSASDTGASSWYFTTPDTWSGDRSEVYNGEIFFKLWHPDQPPAGTDAARPTKDKTTADIILETTCGFSVRVHDIFPTPRVSSALYSIPISHEAASWIDSRTKKRITQVDMLVALSHLRVIKFRGGSMRGAETVRLAEFRIAPPAEGMANRADLEPCCSPHGRMAACQRKGPATKSLSHYPEALTFPGLGFECGGTLLRPESRPRVRFFWPKSSRRSGGARITVFGENFGFNGNSFVRIAGERARNCFIPRAQHCVNGVLDFDEKNVDCGGQNCPPCDYLVPHCSNGVLDYDEDKADCGGKDCERCTSMVLKDHCTNGIRDFDEISVDKGGADCLPTFCFDARIQGDKTDRLRNCGGSCQPCVLQSFAPPDSTASQIAICDSPGNLDLEDAQVSFTRIDNQTSFDSRTLMHETSSCFNDEPEARGFVFDGFDNTWSLHMASLDSKSQSDINVSAIAIDKQTGDAYVTASVTREFLLGDGRITLRGNHLYKHGVHRLGDTVAYVRPVVDNKDDFSLPSDGTGNIVSNSLIHTVLLKVDIHGSPQWLTYMESQSKMYANDILVDTTAKPTRIIVAGTFKGSYPRFYQVNPLTKRAKRGDANERGGGITCSDMSIVTDVSDCWYFQGEPNFQVPYVGATQRPPSPLDIEPEKIGLFMVSYNPHGVATAAKTGIYFKSTGISYPIEGSVRIAAYTTEQRTKPTNSSKACSKGSLEGCDLPSSYVDDVNGVYLSAKILVSRYKDTMYFGEQTPGYSRVGKDYGCTRVIQANGTLACIGGTTIERDVIKIEFPEIIPTPKDDPSYAFIAKYVVGTRSFGSVWVRLIGEIGTNKRTIVSGLEVDESGVYIAGSFSSGALTNLSYQSCEFGERLPECEEGGIYYRKVTGQCWLQEAYIQAPNQVCANINTTVLARHIVRTRDFTKYTDAIRQGMFLASYNHKGVLRWHREAVGGNITVSAMALSTDKDIVLEKQTILNKGAQERQSSVQQRNTRVARRGHFVYVAGNVMQYFTEWISQERDINDQPVGRLIKELEYTNFGQMKYPLSCSQNKTLEYRGQREFKNFATRGKLVNVSATLSIVGDYEAGPVNTSCSGRITPLGSGSDIYLVQFSANDGEPQWLKRYGQRDSWDYVTDIDLNRRYSTVYLTGSFVALTSGLQDIFSMEAAGRADLISCPRWSTPRYNMATRVFEYVHLSGNESVSSCRLSPFAVSSPPNSHSGFIMEVGEGNTDSPGEKEWEQFVREAAVAAAKKQAQLIEEMGPTGDEQPIPIPWTGPKKAASGGVGGSSLPYSHCLEPYERACNADGILWVRTLHATQFEQYTAAVPQNPGRKVASGPDHILVGGTFEGVTTENTKIPYGLQTQGVDDVGFFNQHLDNVETFLVALAP